MPRRRASGRRGRKVAGSDPPPAPRRVEVGADGLDYEVRPVAAARAAKVYRCPGCDHEIRPGTAHVVVWPADAGQASEHIGDRRHWHTPCWAHRATRGPTRRWS